MSLTVAQNLTDEEVLKEFVKRFQCDGAILIYCDRNVEYGFARWRNKTGRLWVKDIFHRVKRENAIKLPSLKRESGITVTL